MCPTIAEMGCGYEIWIFHILGFRSHFAAISQLRNEGHCAAEWHSCAKTAFAIAKYPAEWDFWCEIRLYHFAMRFAAAKWMLLCCEVALVC